MALSKEAMLEVAREFMFPGGVKYVEQLMETEVELGEKETDAIEAAREWLMEQIDWAFREEALSTERANKALELLGYSRRYLRIGPEDHDYLV